jgi:hypothetical protein
LTLVWALLLSSCGYFLGSSLYQKLPEGHDLKIKRFYFHFFFAVIYCAIILIAFNGGYDINQDNYKNYGCVAAIIVPLHLFTMYCMFYLIWFIAKAISTIENKKAVRFDNYAGIFFLIWFFPIGIWWIHPKVRKIFSADEESLPTT